MDIIKYEEKRLLNIEAAAQLLAEARTIEEVTEVRSYAEAVRLVARQAKAGLQAQNAAAELKLRAERRAGEMLASIERVPQNQRGAVAKPHDDLSDRSSSSYTSTIKSAGINHQVAHNWQKAASVPDADFERHVEQTKSEEKELTSVSVVRLADEIRQRDAFNYKRDTKSNRQADEYVPQGFDACQTPAYAIDPLLIHLPDDWTIWEPASGEGLLVEAFHDSEREVVESDILRDQNFFEYEPETWDCIVTNPPFSLKYRWLERCYELGRPFALLLPVETLGAKKAQELMKRYGFEILLLDKRVDFKMPNKGWASGAQFPVLWFCWQLLPEKVMFGSLTKVSYE